MMVHANCQIPLRRHLCEGQERLAHAAQQVQVGQHRDSSVERGLAENFSSHNCKDL